MCLGFPGRVVGFDDPERHLARVDIEGAVRSINVDLVRDEGLDVGDWVLVHLGMAMEIIDEAGADRAMDGLRLLGEAWDDDLGPPGLADAPAAPPAERSR